MDSEAVIEATRLWIASVVIGLDLCPFAGRVFGAGLIRYVVSDAADEKSLCTVLAQELESLTGAPITTVETTILIHPCVLADFLDYNDFLDSADGIVADLGLTGIIQVASFHPGYQFAGTSPDAVENYTNRSPFPMLHLLREESISNIAADPAEFEAIPERNIETLRRMGRAKILEMLRAIRGTEET